MAKSEENRLCLKFNFTSSGVSQKFLGGPLVPYLDTPYSRSQKWLIQCFRYSHFYGPFLWTFPRHPVKEFSMYPDPWKTWLRGEGCTGTTWRSTPFFLLSYFLSSISCSLSFSTSLLCCIFKQFLQKRRFLFLRILLG